MLKNQTIDISQLIERRKIDSFNVKLIVLSFFLVLFDGYDLTVAGYAAPSLIKAWSVANFAVFAPVFSASLFGVLIGSPIYGYFGDRFGRKKAIILSSLNVGILTLVTVFATSVDQLVVLRFLGGIGIGGLLPNIFALNAEFAAKRHRVTSVVLVNIGVAGGAGIPGMVSAALVPTYGWPILFYLGGLIPIAMAAVAALWLPESIRYLALMGRRPNEVRRLVGTLDPALSLLPDATFVLQDETRYERLSAKYLFSNGLIWVTPLLWFLYAADLMSQYLLNSWMPTLLTNEQVSVSRAAIVTAVMQAGGVIGGLAIMRPVDRFGMMPITLLFAFAVPAVGLIGFVGNYPDLLTAVAFLVGFTVIAANLGLNAIATKLYPTFLRSSGVGWALGVGRFGAVLGPLVGGMLISLHMSLQHIFLIATVPSILATVACYMLSRMYTARTRKEAGSTVVPT